MWETEGRDQSQVRGQKTDLGLKRQAKELKSYHVWWERAVGVSYSSVSVGLHGPETQHTTSPLETKE